MLEEVEQRAEEHVPFSMAPAPSADAAILPALIVTNVDGMIELWNSQAEAIYGWTAAEVVGRSVLDVPVQPRDVTIAASIIAQVAAGETWQGLFPVVRKDGTPLDVYVRNTPLLDGDGRVTRIIGESFVASVLVGQSAAQRFGILVEAISLLEGSLDYQYTLQQLAELCVPRLGDNCLVDVPGDHDASRHLAVACTDQDKRGLLEELRRRWPPTPDRPNPALRVFTTGRAELFTDMPPAMWAEIAQDDDHLQVLTSLGLRSGITVPLMAGGDVYGSLSVGSMGSGRVYGDDDLRFLEELGRRAGFAVRNARLYSELADAAQRLQANLLPPTLPAIDGMTLAARYLAAGPTEVGGDFYDVFATGDGEWAILIGDVCGKGAGAAGLTGLVRHTIRAIAARDCAPGEVLSAVNDALLHHDGDESYCTMVYMLLRAEGERRVLTIASGGHPLPLRLTGAGDISELGAPGTILGAVEGAAFPEVTVELVADDTVLLYTDGVTERHSGSRFLDLSGLVDVLGRCQEATADEVAGAVQRAVADFQANAPRDDMAVLVLQAKA